MRRLRKALHGSELPSCLCSEASSNKITINHTVVLQELRALLHHIILMCREDRHESAHDGGNISIDKDSNGHALSLAEVQPEDANVMAPPIPPKARLFPAELWPQFQAMISIGLV